jgi:hypothetical protein
MMFEFYLYRDEKTRSMAKILKEMKTHWMRRNLKTLKIQLIKAFIIEIFQLVHILFKNFQSFIGQVICHLIYWKITYFFI